MFIVSAETLTTDDEDPLNVAVKVDSVSRIRKELFSPAVGLRPIYALSCLVIYYESVVYHKENDSLPVVLRGALLNDPQLDP